MPDHDHEAVGDDATDEVMPVEVLGLQIDPSSGLSIVLLGRLDLSDRVLPIFIGPTEAQAIGFALAEIDVARPTTHDLFVAAIDAAGAVVSDLVIVTLADKTFIAELGLSTESGGRRIDARPSDGLALALRVGCTRHGPPSRVRCCVGRDRSRPVGAVHERRDRPDRERVHDVHRFDGRERFR